jgi:hypothetical protein
LLRVKMGVLLSLRLEPRDSPPSLEGSRSVIAACTTARLFIHGNQTPWPWYGNVAPISWLVQNDVEDGREHLNFSEWDRPQEHAEDAAEEVRDGEMPLWFYVPLHAEARWLRMSCPSALIGHPSGLQMDSRLKTAGMTANI